MFKRLFSAFGGDPLSRLRRTVEEINALEKEVRSLSDQALKDESVKCRTRLSEKAAEGSAALEEEKNALLPRVFALVRETARRTLGQRHFDAQLLGGIVLHEGKIAEMKTGEGKTLAATLPVTLNALTGQGVHVVTVNEYLAKRDAVWMGQIYHALGLSVACLVHEGALRYDPDYTQKIQNPIRQLADKFQINSNDQSSKHSHKESLLLDKERDTTGGFLVQLEYLRPIPRREAYQADITYGTNHEFGFDYLRDNLAYRLGDQVQSERRHYAIVDEVDSILIDEARTPLIISAPDAESSENYRTFARLVARLAKDTDYLVEEKHRSVDITEEGINKAEKTLGVKNLFAPEHLRLTHYLQESLRAKELYLKDRDYVIKDGEIIIVDQFTGRLMLGRRYSGGLHQAIEAKEGVQVKQESRTYATISIQNYFRMYRKLSGMTGTAQTSAEEFDKVYGLAVATIPTNREMIRTDLPDQIYKTLDAKYQAIAREVKARQEKGQPVLIGTVSIEKNEELARYLGRAGIRHEILNAKNNEREGAIIAQAGKFGAVTVATNMAGRGVDIIFGGNPPDPLAAQKVREAGGLHVIGTERHESRRIDNQLRGRSGRQGDPGSSQFFLSLEDDLMRIFGGERLKRMMETLKVPDDMPIQAKMLDRAIAQAQSKVEGMNFDSRKHLLDYDDVLNKQRTAIYKKRLELLATGKLEIRNLSSEITESKTGETEKAEEKNETVFSPEALPTVLSALDMFWMNHLENMEALRESVYLRAYGQHDPLVEYRREGRIMYQQLLSDFEGWVRENADKLATSQQPLATSEKQKPQARHTHFSAVNPSGQSLGTGGSTKIGRNDPCPCGAKKPDGHPVKYKKCHGK